MTVTTTRDIATPEQVRNAVLAALPELELRDGHRGTLKCGSALARIQFEARGWMRARLDRGGAAEPADAPNSPAGQDPAAGLDPAAALAPAADADPLAELKLNRTLPGNVRFAVGMEGLQLIADSRVDGVAHLPASLGEIRAAFRRLGGLRRGGGARIHAPGGTLDPGRAVEALQAAAQGLVEIDGGWELRPRLSGATQPVRVALDGAGLRFDRVFPWPVPAGPAGRAVAREALRINDEIRMSRLSLDRGALVVETRLHGGLIGPGWVASAARAVASAFLHSLPRLSALRADPRAAAVYLSLG